MAMEKEMNKQSWGVEHGLKWSVLQTLRWSSVRMKMR